VKGKEGRGERGRKVGRWERQDDDEAEAERGGGEAEGKERV